MIRKLVMVTTLIVILLSTKVNASEVPVNHVKNTIVQQSVELGVDPALALSIAKVESGFRHSTRSPYGAVGVFQLMPSTAAKIGVNPYQLNDNIRGGIMYYKMMYKMFGSMELALAAYNAGPAYILKHRCAPSYTRGYVAKTMAEYRRLKANPDEFMQKAKDVKTTQVTNPLPIAVSAHGSVKPMTASAPRVINDGTSKLIVKSPQPTSKTPKLQVTLRREEDSLS